MLKCLDNRAQKSTKPNTKPKNGALVSPTLQRYANVTKKRDLSQYLEDEKKGKTTINTTARGITPLYTAVAQNGGLVHAASTAPAAEQGDGKKPFFRAFEHPFVLIDDSALLHAPIWKEYGPDALKTSKSGEPYPVLHWTCPVGFCPFVLPPATVKGHSPEDRSPIATRGITTRSKAAMISTHPSKTIVTAKTSRTTISTQIPVINTIQNQHPPPDTQQKQKVKAKKTNTLNANRARPGYCECCYERYSDLSKHISSLFHRQFALEDKNYAELDRLLGIISRDPIVKVNNENATEKTCVLLRSPVSQKSTDHHGSVGRNYTASKRAKQALALKTFNPGEDDKENYMPTSPSCKRRRSERALIEPVKLEY